MPHDHDREESGQFSIRQMSKYQQKIGNFQHPTAVKMKVDQLDHLQKLCLMTIKKIVQRLIPPHRRTFKRVGVQQNQ
eukprot:1294930-Karenia_brevis.AAC.1